MQSMFCGNQRFNMRITRRSGTDKRKRHPVTVRKISQWRVHTYSSLSFPFFRGSLLLSLAPYLTLSRLNVLSYCDVGVFSLLRKADIEERRCSLDVWDGCNEQLIKWIVEGTNDWHLVSNRNCCQQKLAMHKVNKQMTYSDCTHADGKEKDREMSRQYNRLDSVKTRQNVAGDNK